jgi:cytoskeletal protein CcmA (bactofilin family)
MGLLNSWLVQRLGTRKASVLSHPSAGGTPPSAPSATAEAAYHDQLMRARMHDYSTPVSDAQWDAVNQFLARPERDVTDSLSCLDGDLTVGANAEIVTTDIIKCKTLRVFGKIDAPIFAQRLIIEEGASVNSTARTGEAVISGTFNGTLRVHGEMRLGAKALVQGKLRALTYKMTDGARVVGDMKRVVPKNPEWVQTDIGDRDNGDFPDSMMSMTLTKAKRAA